MPKSQNDFCLFLGLLSLFTLPFLYYSLYGSPSPPLNPIIASPCCTPAMSAIYTQTHLTLPLLGRGSHLITPHITSSVPDIKNIKYGLLHLFLQHTSCALTMNENWDSDVRADMSDALDRIAPEDKKGQGLYRHDAEGSDDMPVSVFSNSLGVGSSLAGKRLFYISLSTLHMRYRLTMLARHISSPLSSVQASAYLSRTASSRLAPGRAYGSWSSEMVSRGGKCWLRCRVKRCRMTGGLRHHETCTVNTSCKVIVILLSLARFPQIYMRLW